MEMTTKRLGTVLDSRTPWIFLTTAVLLSLIGNGFSNLINLLASGSEFSSAVYSLTIGFGGLLILIISFDLLGRIRYVVTHRQTKLSPSPSFSGEVAKRAGLVVAVSSRPDPPAKFAIDHHIWHLPGEKPPLRYCWLLAGPGEGEYSSVDNAERLKKELSDQGVWATIYTLESAHDIAETYETMIKIYDEAFSHYHLTPETMIADYTGGPKPMTVGMLLASTQKGVSLQYMEPKQLEKDGRVFKAAGSIARPVNLNFLPQE